MFSRAASRWIAAVAACCVVGESPAFAATVAFAPTAPAVTSTTASTSAPTPGESDRAEAQRLFERGSDAYNLGRFDQAIEQFEQAYELTQVNALLYNIAQAYTKYFEVDPNPAHLRRAKVMFLNFAKIAETSGEDPRDARQRLPEIDRQLAEFAARQAEERAEAERAEAARLAAERIEAERIAAETRRLEAETRAAAELRYRPGRLGVTGFSLLGVGVFGGIALGAVSGASINRLQDQRSAESGLPLRASRLALYDEHIASAQALGYVAIGVGLGLAVTGIAMIVVDATRRRRPARRVSVGPGQLKLSF